MRVFIPAGFDAAAAFKTEKTGFEAMDHEWVLATAEESALKVLNKALQGA
jgi:hypothetical protein